MGDTLTATIDDMARWNPCWRKSHWRPLAETRERWTALDVLRLADVSAEDRLWVVLRPELLTDRQLRLSACDCAERALERERAAGRESDPRSWEAVRVARAYADGEASARELRRARYDAYGASCVVYGASTHAAAAAAVRSAAAAARSATAAARSAAAAYYASSVASFSTSSAIMAASDAADNAAYTAAAAERQAQVAYLISLLEEDDHV